MTAFSGFGVERPAVLSNGLKVGSEGGLSMMGAISGEGTEFV